MSAFERAETAAIVALVRRPAARATAPASWCNGERDMMAKLVYIYALANPHTGIVRYVGRAFDPKRRYREHLRNAKNGTAAQAVGAWINKLAAEGLTPTLRILDEEYIDARDRSALEGYWIEHYQDTILNVVPVHLWWARREVMRDWHAIYAHLISDVLRRSVELDRIEQGSDVAEMMHWQGEYTGSRYGLEPARMIQHLLDGALYHRAVRGLLRRGIPPTPAAVAGELANLERRRQAEASLPKREAESAKQRRRRRSRRPGQGGAA